MFARKIYTALSIFITSLVAWILYSLCLFGSLRFKA